MSDRVAAKLSWVEARRKADANCSALVSKTSSHVHLIMLLNQVFFSFRETCLFTVAGGGGRKNKKPKPPLMCFTHVHISVCLFTADIDAYCYKSVALKSHRVATYGRRGRLWTSHRPVSPFKKEQVYIQVL